MTLRRVRVTVVAVEKLQVLRILSVCLSHMQCAYASVRGSANRTSWITLWLNALFAELLVWQPGVPLTGQFQHISCRRHVTRDVAVLEWISAHSWRSRLQDACLTLLFGGEEDRGWANFLRN